MQYVDVRMLVFVFLVNVRMLGEHSKLATNQISSCIHSPSEKRELETKISDTIYSVVNTDGISNHFFFFLSIL